MQRPTLFCFDHDWRSGQMYSDGWTDTCNKCGATREVHR